MVFLDMWQFLAFLLKFNFKHMYTNHSNGVVLTFSASGV